MQLWVLKPFVLSTDKDVLSAMCGCRRFFVPIAWAICYQMVVPDNLIWSVLVPFALISWQRGALPTPANLEWWLIMFFGLYWKCWDQVCGILAFFFKWW